MLEAIDRYLRAIDRPRGAARPTEAEVRAIALELGASEADLAEADRAAEDARTRGRAYIQAGMGDEAVGELRQLVALRPWDDPAGLLLARALLLTRRAADRAEADMIAEEVLARQPASAEAIAVRRDAAARLRVRSGLGRLLGIGVVASLAAAMWGWLPGGAPTRGSAEALPVELVAPDLPGLTYRPHSAASHWHTRDRWWQDEILAGADTRGLLHNQGEPVRVQLRLEAYGADGAVILAAGTRVGAPPLQPGDTTPIGASVSATLATAPAPIVGLRLIVVDVERLPAASTPATFVSAGEVPYGARFEVRARAMARAGHHDTVVLEVHNVGATLIEDLKLAAAFEDKDGRQLGAPQELYVAGVLYPGMLPGEVRVVEAGVWSASAPPARVVVANGALGR